MTIEPFRTRHEPPSFQRDLPLPVGNVFLRLIAAKVRANIQHCPPADIAARMWPSDHLIARAAVAPAMTTVTGWAAELAQRTVADALTALGPMSAGAALLQQGTVLTFAGYGSISAPGFVADLGNAGWVAEGQPIPVRQLSATAVALNPHKLAAIAVLTREMVESSNAEQLIGDTLGRAAGRALDEALFDANPEDAARPRGLRNGVAAATPSNNTTFFEAAFEDASTLINAVAPVAGNGPVVLIASPGRAATMMMRYDADADDPNSRIVVLGSNALTNDIVAVAPAALVAALSPEPDIETSNASTLVMVDTTPGAAGTQGPERNMFQIDSIALKMHWPVTWALRDPRGVAWLTPSWK